MKTSLTCFPTRYEWSWNKKHTICNRPLRHWYLSRNERNSPLIRSRLHCTSTQIASASGLHSPAALRFLRLRPSSARPGFLVSRQVQCIPMLCLCNKENCHSVKISWLRHGKNRREPCWRVRVLHSIDNSNKENPIHLYRAFRWIQQLDESSNTHI